MERAQQTGMDANVNNCRKSKRGNSSSSKIKKQLENELNRQRSFFVTGTPRQNNGQHVQRENFNKSINVLTGVKKPTLEIYRPPTNGLQKSKGAKNSENSAVPVDECKLNVHAKEFTIERSKTAPQSIMNYTKHEKYDKNIGIGALSRSRTFFTNGDFRPNNQKKSYDYKSYKPNFQQTKNILHQKDSLGLKVQFKEPFKQKTKNEESSKCSTILTNDDYSLRRSKSYNGQDNKYVDTSSKTLLTDFNVNELNNFPEDISKMAKSILNDTKNSPVKDLMLLALKIIEHAVNSKIEDLNPSVNLSLHIIEEDTRDTYVNMIINTVQLWFVKREKLLQPPRLYSYATFVLQIYRGMKQNKVLLNRMELEYYSRKQALLMLLAKICEHCLLPDKGENANAEVNCMFSIVNAVGPDLEQEIPDTLQQLYVTMRDTLLTQDCSTFVKKSLLHLIELRAFKWALPQPTLDFYNSMKTNNA
ncbi:uncharacterized protein LOC126839298 isoform X2 [Adelges cooleyi]|uniref:uncharacterized protein LOC126839298 isoform X2 n=1 Tax=Adelges cooleyi TaxID=133065 RepID=UPI0021805271|nr:uncharacterized protein LOC126839298 isoform X2 [Adelges cooleyi]